MLSAKPIGEMNPHVGNPTSDVTNPAIPIGLFDNGGEVETGSTNGRRGGIQVMFVFPRVELPGRFVKPTR